MAKSAVRRPIGFHSKKRERYIDGIFRSSHASFFRTRHSMENAVELDEIDKRLIALLQDDASRPVKWLAAELGISISSVHRRREALCEKGVIRRFTVEVDPAGAGRPILFLVEVLLERERVPMFASPSPIARRPNIKLFNRIDPLRTFVYRRKQTPIEDPVGRRDRLRPCPERSRGEDFGLS
jgi:DNA-binding Lrp family transcriptional regulator